MSDLLKKKCIPQRRSFPFDLSEIHKYQKVDGWDIVKNESEIYYLERNLLLKLSKNQKFVNRLEKYQKMRDIIQILFWVG